MADTLLFKVEEGEKVVSVVGLADETSAPEGGPEGANGEAAPINGDDDGGGPSNG